MSDFRHNNLLKSFQCEQCMHVTVTNGVEASHASGSLPLDCFHKRLNIPSDSCDMRLKVCCYTGITGAQITTV